MGVEKGSIVLPRPDSRRSFSNGITAWASTDWKQRFRRRLLAWYGRHARPLPWRGTRDPYRIWVSEIMLQQTQVATVAAYYERFLKTFPTIASLACAEEEAVLREWEGLGYYRRARQMHQAARKITGEHGATFPQEADELRRLPGIGRYTAGAIASIAFDAREPILEANTIRLVSRLIGYRGDPRGAEGQRTLWAAVESWLPQRRVGAFNQALMELGSLVCTPREPECAACPVAALCAARQLDLVDEIPQPARRPAVESLREAAVVVWRGRRVLLSRRDDAGRWAGLWDFPRFEVKGSSPTALRRELAIQVARLTNLTIQPAERLTVIKHGVTRFRITLECYEARCLAGALPRGRKSPHRWVTPPELNNFPLSVTARRISRLIARHATQHPTSG